MDDSVKRDYGYFQIGDSIHFSRKYNQEDFVPFRELSGDNNPLHHDSLYARKTAFSKPIVPMHLATLPLSSIAGMMLPGHRSLYLSSKIKSLKPIYYGENITYSSKIIAKNDLKRTLTLKTIGFVGNKVLLDCEQLVQVRDDVDSSEDNKWDGAVKVYSNSKPIILLTGASGEIAYSTALSLSQVDCKLVLVYRRKKERIVTLEKELEIRGVRFSSFRVDFTQKKEWAAILSEIIKENSITHIIHTASSPLDAGLSDLIDVNYRALKQMIDALLPGMLKKQFGKIILVGSSAMQYHPLGWEDYTASKFAAVSLIKSINKNFLHYGISASVIAPGIVETNFSENIRSVNTRCLLPEQVAETITRVVENKRSSEYIWQEPDNIKLGTYGFISSSAKQNGVQEKTEKKAPVSIINNDKLALLDELMRDFFSLKKDYDLMDTGVNYLAEWDSLRHIELLLYLEKELEISFKSYDIDQTQSYQGIRSLVAGFFGIQ